MLRNYLGKSIIIGWVSSLSLLSLAQAQMLVPTDILALAAADSNSRLSEASATPFSTPLVEMDLTLTPDTSLLAMSQEPTALPVWFSPSPTPEPSLTSQLTPTITSSPSCLETVSPSPTPESMLLKILAPRNGLTTHKPYVHLLGRTKPLNLADVNGVTVAVYATGAFARDFIPLEAGANTISVRIEDDRGNSRTTWLLVKQEPASGEMLNDAVILSPSSKRMLRAGDILQIRAKGPSQADGLVRLWNGRVELALTEAEINSSCSYYSATWQIPENFVAPPQPFLLRLQERQGFLWFRHSWEKISRATIEVINPTLPRIAETVSERTPIAFSSYQARLGGPYVAEVPSGTRFQIIGREGEQYKIALTPALSAWVEAEDVKLLAPGTILPQVTLTTCVVDGDKDYDKILLPLEAPVLYAITPESNQGNYLYIDIFNASFATTWFIHRAGAKIIGPLKGEQVADNWYRIIAPIRSKQLWGYWSEKNYLYGDKKIALAILVKRPPRFHKRGSALKGLVLGLEAGHGGSNSGAIGIVTGMEEKNVNPKVVEKMKSLLTAKGAKVVLLRSGDASLTMAERIKTAHQARADFVLSLHANYKASEQGFLNPTGVSTYYKYSHCRLAAEYMQAALLGIGWADYGIIGNFNYALLRDTRIPGILIELGFLSNPADEAQLLDPAFQQKEVQAMVKGLEQFLQKVRE